MAWVIMFAVTAVLLGVITGLIADRKGEDFGAWWLFGTLLFIVALPMALLLPVNHKGLASRKNCPYCGATLDRIQTDCDRCHRAQPEAFWSRKSSTKNWEQTVKANDEVEKWAESQEKEP